jgi:hypothetical protein
MYVCVHAGVYVYLWGVGQKEFKIERYATRTAIKTGKTI